MNIGDLVRVHGNDQHGQDVSGMTGRLLSTSPLYAEVALTCWPGVTVRVVRRDLVPVEAGPQSVVRWKAAHAPWKVRNQQVIERMRRAA